MENKQIVFTQTTSGDRTNIMSSFQLWSKETFLKKVKEDNSYGRYRYGYIDGGYVSLLKDMRLDEFETVFDPTFFNPAEITEIFRKEISEKYGEHKAKKELKSLKKSEIERGYTYLDVNGNEWLYLGQVEQTTDKTYLRTYQSEKKPVEVVTGNGFIDSYYIDRPQSYPINVDVIKSMKKLVSKVDKPKVEFLDEYVYQTGKMTYSFSERKVTLKFL